MTAHARISATVEVSTPIAVSFRTTDSWANQDLARGIGSVLYDFGQAQEPRTEPQLRALECVDIHGEPHSAAFDEQVGHAAHLGEFVVIADRQDGLVLHPLEQLEGPPAVGIFDVHDV